MDASRETIKSLLIGKAMSDPAFRDALLADPRRAIEQLANGTLPAGLDIKVVQDSGTKIHLVLPPAAPAEGELAEAELEGVAGGAGGGADFMGLQNLLDHAAQAGSQAVDILQNRVSN